MFHTLILNDKGMATCQAEDLLHEIEYVLGISGKLRIVGKYTNAYHDFSRNYQWQEDRGAVRCIEKGYILRLEVIGDPIDIFSIKVYALAMIDRNEYATGYALEEIIPTEILNMFREQYDPLLSGQKVSLWHSEMLKGEQDHE